VRQVHPLRRTYSSLATGAVGGGRTSRVVHDAGDGESLSKDQEEEEVVGISALLQHRTRR
jgi:hypothetical protein